MTDNTPMDTSINTDIPKPERQFEEVEKRIQNYWESTQKYINALLTEHEFESEKVLTLLPPSDNENQDAQRPLTAKVFQEFQAESLIFNTRLQFSPSVIVKCQSTEQVQTAYTQAIAHNLPIRVRSGGHDHEGECTGTDVVLLDLGELKHFHVDTVECAGKSEYIAHIGSGYRFYQVVPKLAAHEPPLTIPHGTCATVGLAGYIQGGGWGPWTRAKGMCCESLVGATVVLQNGEVIDVSENENEDLLWALRGGGALSYGIVTEFRVKAFELPDEIHRFEINWNNDDEHAATAPTWNYLTQWEEAINDATTTHLVGTNLKINAIPKTVTYVKEVKHPGTMFGYWSGTAEELEQFASAYFPGATAVITGTDTKTNYNSGLMSDWSRNSLSKPKELGINALQVANAPDQNGAEPKPFTPDFDAPAPHKITSKLVGRAPDLNPNNKLLSDNPAGLNDTGKAQLIQSLTSDLVFAENAPLGLFSYVTLGAIAGPFYQQEFAVKAQDRVAFPYTDSKYTIQYQTWWNTELTLSEDKVSHAQQSLQGMLSATDMKSLGQNNPVYQFVNRALDWIEVSRDTEIEGAYGAFISFKDSSIPTKTYFQQNYDKLLTVKKHYSGFKLPILHTRPELSLYVNFNHLRTRKTIM